MKSPAELRSQLNNAIANINSLKVFLEGKRSENIAGIGAECSKVARLLDEIINKNRLPETYKVAVVGRFKAGKSSFVNELLGSKLAGEDTSPETAAVTTFKYGDRVQATIQIIDKKSWEAQKKLFLEDQTNQDAHRVKVWDGFSKPKKTNEANEEIFDLEEIENSLVREERNEILISLDGPDLKAAEKKFRERLKLYTSGSKPYHCLVSSINIISPSEFLKDGIELIDTPGLDDTEKFRVSLTEQSVQDVDAILFLTKSGVAYGQSEKDFLMTLLRKGTVKQLMIVITQVDQTYLQHVKSAEDNDDEPQTVKQRISIENIRIQDEIHKTLIELAGADSLIAKTYQEQFSNIDIAFTSVMAHREFKAKKPFSVQIYESDPGGLIRCKTQLVKILSTESRIATSASIVINQSKATLEDLADSIDAKVNAIRSTHNREEVERRLQNFRAKFKEYCEGAAGELKEILDTFRESTDNRLDQQKTKIENIALKAEKELRKFRENDLARHWKTRRNEKWGFLFDLQNKVANRIFPSVQEMLESHVEDFSRYIKRHEQKISKLTKSAEAAAKELQLGEMSGFDVKKQLKELTNRIVDKTQDRIEVELEEIIKLLDTFVSEEVEAKISEKRQSVATIFGKGTTAAQQAEVSRFYAAIESLLSEALSAHISNRNFTFANSLVKNAEHAPKETFHEIDLQLEKSIENLRQVAQMTLDGQKEQAESLLSEIKTNIISVAMGLSDLSSFVPIDADSADNSLPDNTALGDVSGDKWPDVLLHDAKNLYSTFSLRDGESGWPLSRIFDHKIFVGVQLIYVVEPYLIKAHQLRNLQEFLLLVVENSKPKQLSILTLPFPSDRKDYNDRFFNELGKSLFQDYGVLMEVEFCNDIHDRYVFFDSGYVAKLGRGLDIYKPSTGLASHRPELRKVRGCEIAIFSRQ